MGHPGWHGIAIGVISSRHDHRADRRVVVSGGTAQSWAAGTSGGSGTLPINSINSTGASGTFAFTMVPVPGTGASGTKSVTNGNFSVTF